MATATQSKSQLPWQMVALASGAFAAFNGLFAKLTTNDITAQWINQATSALQLDATASGNIVAYTVRGLVFALSFASTSIMWMLFTSALARSPSAVHANILNTIANFVLTALIGNTLFGEHLPGRWWIGAGMLIAGGVIIGQRGSEDKTDTVVKKSQ